jgi:hypothetical protein
MHAAIDLASTFLNIYSMQDGQWSVTAVITTCIIGNWLIVSFALYILYGHILLPKLKEKRWIPVS